MFKKIVIVLIFVATFVGAQQLVRLGFEKYEESKVVAAVEDKLAEIEAEADREDSGLPRSEAIQEIAIKKAEENIQSKATPQQRKETAVSTFMGFYLVNYRTRSEFCADLGVSISSFTGRFRELHRDELDLSRNTVFKNDIDVDKVYDLLGPQLERVIDQDMNDLASQYGVDLAGACELVEQNGAAFAEAMHISKVQPAVYAELYR